MADWRTARSLLTLREQYNKKYPTRNKASDGTIGDLAHLSRTSDHNPDKDGVVHALDITHDPSHGLDIGVEAQRLVDSRDKRIKYVIVNRKICEPGNGGWAWRDYTGQDPHTGHVHISVNASNGDDDSPWYIESKPKEDIMTDTQIDRTIAAAYMLIKGTKPEPAEWDFHRKQFRERGASWVVALLEGFKDDDIAWKKYERNLKDASKLLNENPDAKAVAEIKKVLGIK